MFDEMEDTYGDRPDARPYYNGEENIKALESDYYDFLNRVYSDLKEVCRKNGYLWFDRCSYQDFFNFANDESVSSGPPRRIASHHFIHNPASQHHRKKNLVYSNNS